MPFDAQVAAFIDAHRARGLDAGASCAEALTLEAQERWKAAHDEVSSWVAPRRGVGACCCAGWHGR